MLTPKPAETLEDNFLYAQSPSDKLLAIPASENRSRINSDSVWPAGRQTSSANGRRSLSFNETTAYSNYITPPTSPPYLLDSEVSLNTLPASSLSKQPKKNSWFGRWFKSRKEKSENSWQTVSTDEHRSMMH